MNQASDDRIPVGTGRGRIGRTRTLPGTAVLLRIPDLDAVGREFQLKSCFHRKPLGQTGDAKQDGRRILDFAEINIAAELEIEFLPVPGQLLRKEGGSHSS